jgi:hypothetical protein
VLCAKNGAILRRPVLCAKNGAILVPIVLAYIE